MNDRIVKHTVGRRCWIQWKDNKEIEYFNSLTDLGKRFNVGYVTAKNWIDGKRKTPLPFILNYEDTELPYNK